MGAGPRERADGEAEERLEQRVWGESWLARCRHTPRGPHTEGSLALRLVVTGSAGELRAPSTDVGRHLLWEPRAMISV